MNPLTRSYRVVRIEANQAPHARPARGPTRAAAQDDDGDNELEQADRDNNTRFTLMVLPLCIGVYGGDAILGPVRFAYGLICLAIHFGAGLA